MSGTEQYTMCSASCLAECTDQYIPVQKLNDRLTSIPKQLAHMSSDRSHRMSDTSTDTALMR